MLHYLHFSHTEMKENLKINGGFGQSTMFCKFVFDKKKTFFLTFNFSNSV
jgi:hypothetical protein